MQKKNAQQIIQKSFNNKTNKICKKSKKNPKKFNKTQKKKDHKIE